MGSGRRSSFIVAVLFIISLTLSGIAEAGNPLAIGGPMMAKPALREQAGLLDQGVIWLAALWSDLKAVFAEETTGSDPVPQDCVPSTNCGDAGPGIDPEG